MKAEEHLSISKKRRRRKHLLRESWLGKPAADSEEKRERNNVA